MKTQEVKTAPRSTDAVNVVWRSHAANILRKVCPSLTDKDVCLGRLSFSENNKYNRVHGYVVFYALVHRYDLSRTQRTILWWKDLRRGKNSGEAFILMVKAFRNKKGKPRKALLLPFDELTKAAEYRPNDTFRAVENTEWRYAVRGNDCEILTEYFYQKEKREAGQK